ncbi:MAG TPA: hypothetical protein VGN52_04550 [Burkholderiales bacterium]|jgi:hypothetical protein
MPVTQVGLITTPYAVMPLAGPPRVPHPAPPPPPPPASVPGVTHAHAPHGHTSYDWNSCRGNLVEAQPVPGVDARHRIGVNRVPPGNAANTIMLPFFADHITSVRLPCPAPVGITLFVTDAMSGCKFFVDSINGSNDLMVYHANTTNHGPGVNAHADAQLPAAGIDLDALHVNAQGDYPALALVAEDDCAKGVYFQAGGDEERRKLLQGRRNRLTPNAVGAVPSFVGGCTVVGFPAGNSWEFWYQCHGDVGYKRPTGFLTVSKSLVTLHWNYLRKRIVEGEDHVATVATAHVMDHGRIYP